MIGLGPPDRSGHDPPDPRRRAQAAQGVGRRPGGSSYQSRCLASWRLIACTAAPSSSGAVSGWMAVCEIVRPPRQAAWSLGGLRSGEIRGATSGQDVHEGKDLCLCPCDPPARFASGVFVGVGVCWMSASVPLRQAGESDPRSAAPRQRPTAKGSPAWPGWAWDSVRVYPDSGWSG